jgi:hypothetical protein
MGEDKILTLRVLPTEDSQVGGTEVGSGPFAFDGDRLVGPASQDEVNFVATFVPPIRDLTALLAAQNDRVQYEVLHSTARSSRRKSCQPRL